MRGYFIKKYIGNGILLVACFPYGDQLWVLSEQKVRKNHECCNCRKTIKKGVDRAYKPSTNVDNRWERLCVECAKKWIASHK